MQGCMQPLLKDSTHSCITILDGLHNRCIPGIHRYLHAKWNLWSARPKFLQEGGAATADKVPRTGMLWIYSRGECGDYPACMCIMRTCISCQRNAVASRRHGQI